jgi:hypothetical protein
MQVTPAQAKDFGRVWTHNGIAIFMDDANYKVEEIHRRRATSRR